MTKPSVQVAARASGFRPRRPSWWPYAWMYGAVGLLHLIGWVTLLAFVVPGQFHVPGKGVFGVALGVTAYTLGMRHAFDADHIAAIDNTTRKLREERGRQPITVGFWFSLGHSTVVTAMVAAIAFGVHTLARNIRNQNSFVEQYAGVFGASVSGVFLLIIGLLNLVVLVGIVGVFARMRRGEYREAELEDQLAKRGLMNRFFGGLMRFVRRPWHIYPIGVLFGFGFDTVTEVALLAIAGTAAGVAGLPWYAVLVLPVLFTAGMTVLDSSNGAFMNSAYGWAFAKPVRKVFYNMTVTTISVIVAVVVGVIELIGVIAGQLGITTGPFGWIAGISLNYVGFGVVAVFVVAWAVALSVWHFGRIEQRWTNRLAGSNQQT
ncbi:MAG: HoxN/HupN/NixA family nickel/cobalt transporter [Streptosporangiales bacterium]